MKQSRLIHINEAGFQGHIYGPGYGSGPECFLDHRDMFVSRMDADTEPVGNLNQCQVIFGKRGEQPAGPGRKPDIA